MVKESCYVPTKLIYKAQEISFLLKKKKKVWIDRDSTVKKWDLRCVFDTLLSSYE